MNTRRPRRSGWSGWPPVLMILPSVLFLTDRPSLLSPLLSRRSSACLLTCQHWVALILPGSRLATAILPSLPPGLLWWTLVAGVVTLPHDVRLPAANNAVPVLSDLSVGNLVLRGTRLGTDVLAGLYPVFLSALYTVVFSCLSLGAAVLCLSPRELCLFPPILCLSPGILSVPRSLLTRRPAAGECVPTSRSVRLHQGLMTVISWGGAV